MKPSQTRIDLDNHWRLEFLGDGWALIGGKKSEKLRTLDEAAGLAVEKMYKDRPNMKIQYVATLVIGKIVLYYKLTRLRME